MSADGEGWLTEGFGCVGFHPPDVKERRILIWQHTCSTLRIIDVLAVSGCMTYA